LDLQHNLLTILDKNHIDDAIDFENGCLILVNKPQEWTSFDVVNKIKYSLMHQLGKKKIKVGHAGTLDPMADGLLIVCTGKYTKLLETISGVNKSYKAIIKIGATTPCYDREAAEENIKSIDSILVEDINRLAARFEGIQQQIPPIYSAIKVKGQTAYKLARRGEDIELKPRTVEIKNIQISDITLPYVTFDVDVSKGTYIRSLANDMGIELGVGAYLYGLTRTRVGDYRLENALNVEEIVSFIKK
jgi:tRNA pseudouridine55 synthase